MMKAKITTKQGRMTPDGREMVMEVRAGEKGTGQQIGPSVTYWPWSGVSYDKAVEIVGEIIRRNELELSNETPDG